MRYQCLVLDHDDTVVNSTATINYPAFVQTLQKLRPDVHMTLDDFFSYSFEPGFGALCSDILGFSDAEMDIQYQTWLDYVRTHVPDTFPGMRDLLQRFHAAGGHICVVSHSVPENILRDYRAHDLPTPERIYGWDSDPERRKPAPWPIYQIERELGLRPEQLVVIDDLKPGKDMADRAGVDFIAAGWTHTVPHIIETMQRICPHYCRTVAELAALLLVCILLGGMAYFTVSVLHLITQLAVNSACDLMQLKINAAVTAATAPGQGDYYTYRTDADGTITAVSIDTEHVGQVSSLVLEHMMDGDDGQVELDIPLETLFGVNFLPGLKLPLPVRILVLTTSDVNYHNELMSAAINQSKYQLYLNVKMDLDILVPWEHQTETVGTNVLLAETVIVGKVPQTYVEVE